MLVFSKCKGTSLILKRTSTLNVGVGCLLLKIKLRFTESEQEVTHWLSALGTGRSCSLALRLEKDFDLFASGLSADMVGGRLEVDFDFLVFGG